MKQKPFQIEILLFTRSCNQNHSCKKRSPGTGACPIQLCRAQCEGKALLKLLADFIDASPAAVDDIDFDLNRAQQSFYLRIGHSIADSSCKAVNPHLFLTLQNLN